jgi:excisionase family DNA binding protein
MSPGKKKEITVEVVAAQLGVSERSVVNYLKTRRIEGIKVGKKWFIDAASVDAFASRYGFSPKPIPVTERTSMEVNTNSVGPDSKSAISENQRGQYQSCILQLHVFKLCCEVFSSEAWIKSNSTAFEERLHVLKNRVFEELGAGFYSFGAARKSTHYNSARTQIGAMLSLIYFTCKSDPVWSNQLPILESKLLPAFSALLRKIERRRLSPESSKSEAQKQKSKQNGETRDGFKNN